MQPIWESKLIQIEVTNACINQCSNCNRCVGHHLKPFFMDLETVEKAIESLENYPGNIGLMGGEPTLHPQFPEICAIFQKKIPKKRRELWTAGYKWDEYKYLIWTTFEKELISFNDHSSLDGKHHPFLVASKDIVPDSELRKALIDNCWVQKRWSASITPFGCYFCEVAAAIDIAMGGKNGWPIEKDWWKKIPSEFGKQLEICQNCGATIPIGETSDHASYDIISKSNLEKLKNSPKIKYGNYALYEKKWNRDDIIAKSREWKPYQWRTFYAHSPEDYPKITGGKS